MKRIVPMSRLVTALRRVGAPRAPRDGLVALRAGSCALADAPLTPQVMMAMASRFSAAAGGGPTDAFPGVETRFTGTVYKESERALEARRAARELCLDALCNR